MDSNSEWAAALAPVRIRKKPVVIEAMRFDGSTGCATAIVDWILGSGGTARYHDPADGEFEGEPHIAVDTLEGVMRGGEGWWFARGVEGEFYPIKPSVVEATYDVGPEAEPDGEVAVSADRARQLDAAERTAAEQASELEHLRSGASGPGSFWTQAEWAEWSNRLAEMIPEGDESRYSDPEAAQEAIIEDALRAYIAQADRAARLEEERSRLRNVCIRLAAPLGWATSGTTRSAIHHITSYVQQLEAQARGAEDAEGAGSTDELNLEAPGPIEVSQRLADYPLLRFFAYGHLPTDLQRVSAPFAVLAFDTVRATEWNPETAVALRKLLEAKDAAVRAKVAELTEGRPSTAAADFSTWFPPVVG